VTSSSSSVTHSGLVVFEHGEYRRQAGTENWVVQPIAGFGLDIAPPLGQIRIVFAEPVSEPYVVMVTPSRTTSTPHLCANYGNVEEGGFVVHLFDPMASGTLANGGFSFVVLGAAA
jgi:hypothetical protein